LLNNTRVQSNISLCVLKLNFV